MKGLLVMVSVLFLASCSRGCCMERCSTMLYQCNSIDKELQPRCLDLVDRCTVACGEAPGTSR